MPKRTQISMPVLHDTPPRKRRWSLPHWRALSLATVHLLILAHIVQWLVTGTTINPVEPSESMETIRTGGVNAGFIFFGVALLITLVAGRFVCGWGCHFIAYQDLSTYVLKKLGIRPRPLRSRLLALVPLGLAGYMFIWPMAYRWWTAWRGETGTDFFPEWRANFYTEHFWETFPGWVFAILTFGIAGFAIVYFLGSKGFCTYACPYGGFFRPADRVAPLRVRVNRNCDHSGVCTTVCSSNVSIAEEVARYGMVVDPNCMKCGDCLQACPNQALSWSLGVPSLLTRRRSTGTPSPPPPPAESGEATPAPLPWREELFLLAAFLFFLFSWRGLYDGFPLLMSAGMSAILAYLALTVARLLYRPTVTLQRTPLKSERGLTPRGWLTAGGVLAICAFTVHSAVVQYHRHLGGYHFNRTGVGEVVWQAGFDPDRDLSDAVRARRDRAQHHLAACASWSLIDTVEVQNQLAWLALLKGDMLAAERHARRAVAIHPEWSAVHHNLARILRLRGDLAGAIAECRRAVALDPEASEAGHDLGAMLRAAGLWTEALDHYREFVKHHPDDAPGHYYAGAIALQLGRPEEAVPHLQRAVQRDPQLAEAQYQLGLAFLTREQVAEGARCLEIAVRLRPQMADGHYNLAVARFMQGDLAAALPHAIRAVELNPDDARARAFAQMLRSEMTP
jgi:tetratricopeptide (TPR) repeat protein/NAD-dependent dihydropyrimidine dehydrogenase PreA subunit